jgi:hypothetical protein
MNALVHICRILCIAAVALWIVPRVFLVQVKPGEIGVRQSSLSGVHGKDLEPGWHYRVPGVHKVHMLPATFDFLDYSGEEGNHQESLQIRTRDNNIVLLDVSVPVRIRPGYAHALVEAGNHARDANGRYRFNRLAEETTVSVLREHLADLDSVGFYTTERRLVAAERTLEVLERELEPLNVSAEVVLVRAVRFRPEYENQLQQIQLNEQNKLLDQSRERVANEQQTLDNFLQGTAALAAARQQDWIKRQADLELAYQVGFIGAGSDARPGEARRALEALGEGELEALRERAAAIFGMDADSVGQPYLLGIKNIQAETLEYQRRVTAEADGIAARLTAEGAAKVARVQGEYDSRINALLNSPAGRAYVAWKSAEKVTFAKKLTFHSSDGIPSVLRLRRFAELFMGR